MLTLKNFDKQIDSVILQRGEKYYRNGHVLSIEEQESGIWSAEVQGTETYEVEVTIKNKGQITDYFCDCPYENGICKHAVAVCFALREEILKVADATIKKPIKKTFESLVQSVSHTEYQDFVRKYALKNKQFKLHFELFFSDKDTGIELEKKYTELVQKLIKNHARHGYIEYQATKGLSNEIDQLLATGLAYLSKENFRDAFTMAKAILKPMMETMEYSDDSNGSLGDSIYGTIELLEKISRANTVAINIKEEIFNFLEKELNDNTYFNYGDFGYRMFEVYEQLAIALDKSTPFLAFIELQLSKLSGRFDEYRKEFFQQSQITFFQQTGKADKAEILVQQHLDIVDVRMDVVNKAIAKRKFDAAKKLIADGIKVAESKQHPGTVDQWKEALLRIAKLENDTHTIRLYTKYFAFNRGFSTEYYKQWKATFDHSEWKEVIEKEIVEITQKVTKEWSNQKHNFWGNTTTTPLLPSIAPIYIQEKYFDRLLALVQQQNNLDTILNYHQYLVKDYATDLLAIYLPALEEYSANANSRSDYAGLVKTMKKIIKDIPEGKIKIVTLAKKLREKYSSKPRRPAMIEELDKLL